MNIKLIKPDELWSSGVSSAETFKVQQLSLPLLAAYAPDEHNVKIVDESFIRDNTDEDVDLVGITVMTDLALRAYQIADDYRKRDIRVVMGGIHPSARIQRGLRRREKRKKLHEYNIIINDAENLQKRI